MAAQATTYLAAGFAGDEQAGARAIWCVAATVLLGILMMAWNSLQNYIDQFTSYKINSAISDQLYEHFVSIDFWRYDDKDTADMFDKAQSFVSFFSRFFDAMARIIASIVSVIVALASLFSVSWWIGLILSLISGSHFILVQHHHQEQNRHDEYRRLLDALFHAFVHNQGGQAQKDQVENQGGAVGDDKGAEKLGIRRSLTGAAQVNRDVFQNPTANDRIISHDEC